MKILILRFKQVKRIARELGLLYAILLSGFIGFLYYGAIVLFNQLPDSFLPHTGYTIGVLLVILSLHLRRKDRQFLALHITSMHKIFIIEYLVLISPILIYILINGYFIQSVLCLAGVCAISHTHISIKRFALKPRAFFKYWLNNMNMEWISVLRKNWLGIIIIYILLTGSMYLSPYSILIAWLILFSYLPTVYEYFEPVHFIESTTYDVGTFIQKKIWYHFLVLLVISSPILIIFLYVHSEYYFIALAGLICSMLLIFWINYFKYAHYSHRKNSSVTYKYMLSISIVIFFIALPLVYLLMVIKWNWYKHNMEYYLTGSHD